MDMPTIQNETRKIKEHLENILKDSKILCELEPFVKKWSRDLEETYTSILDSNNDAITGIRNTMQSICGVDDTESNTERTKGNMLREMKVEGVFPAPDGYPKRTLCHYSHPDNENLYDEELGTVLRSLDNIEMVPAVTEADIEEYIRGLGGKPDGPDLNRTNIREWKHIFMEQWLHMQRLEQEQMTRYINSPQSYNKPESTIKHIHQNGPILRRNVDTPSQNSRNLSCQSKQRAGETNQDKCVCDKSQGHPSLISKSNPCSSLQSNSMSQNVSQHLREEKSLKRHKTLLPDKCGRSNTKNTSTALPTGNKLSPPPSRSPNKDKHVEPSGKPLATKASSQSLPTTNIAGEQGKKQLNAKELRSSCVRLSSAVPTSYMVDHRRIASRRSRLGIATKLHDS